MILKGYNKLNVSKLKNSMNIKKITHIKLQMNFNKMAIRKKNNKKYN